MEPTNNPAPQTPPTPPQTPPAPQSESTPAPKRDTLMSILAYIGPLVIVSYFIAKEDPFVKFHIRQGLVLLVLEVILWIIGSIFWMFWPIIQIVHIAILVFIIIGIMNVVKGLEKELPWIGSYGSKFKI